MIKLSVIIPTHNRAHKLRPCLEALANQTLPAANYEVVVSIDGSTDGTDEMLSTLVMPYSLRAQRLAKSGVSAVRNHAAVAAHGATCLFIDDDVVGAPSLLAEHLRGHEAQPGVVVLGPLHQPEAPQADAMTRAFTHMWNGHYERLNRRQRPAAWHDCYGGNFSVERELFLRVGGFALDLPISEDAELGYRLAQAGAAFLHIPGACAEHADYKDFYALAADAERHGRANIELCRRYPPMWPVPLGTFNTLPPREARVRAWLLARNVSARPLAGLTRLARNRAWEAEWGVFLLGYFYWRGVRQAASAGEWLRITAYTPGAA
jgi:glycosyltransferase involved in cell wall biosynthesis